MTINDRFNQIIKSLYQGNKRAFSNAIGVSPTVTENIVGSRQGNPSYELLCKVCANANISERWLLTGEGEMLKGQPDDMQVQIVQEVTPMETRPRIPVSAAAGSLDIAINPVLATECEQLPVIPSLPKYDFTITVKGDSMEPDLHSGDELACLFIRNKSFLQWGKTHVMDTAQGVVVKRIFEANNNILCRSVNRDAYPDFSIPKDEVYHIALVVGLVRRL